MKQLSIGIGTFVLALGLATTVSASSLNFTVQSGGTGVAVMPSYGTLTLTLNTTDTGCTVAGHPCINISATAPTGYGFYDQAGDTGIFGFNDPGQTLEFLNCSGILASECGPSFTSGPASGAYDGIGTFGFSVDTNGSIANNFATAVVTSFSFDVLDTTTAFTSIANLENPEHGTVGTMDFGAHICLLALTTTVGGCALDSNQHPADHAYVGAVVPEPATMALLGTGLAFIGGRLRRRVKTTR